MTFFRLDGKDDTLVLFSKQSTLPRLLYWGPNLPTDLDLDSLAAVAERPKPNGGLDVEEVVSWIPEPGRGFTDAPGIELRRGSTGIYTQFEISDAQRTETSWSITCRDLSAQVTLDLHITLDGATGILAANCVLTNHGVDELHVDALASMVLPVPERFTERLSLGGRWAQEFQSVREKIGSAAWLQESRLGRTSHHAFPGLALMASGTTIDQGDVWAAHLAWSGNHRTLLQRCRLGGLQLQMAELLLPGEVNLTSGQSYATPTLYLARSDAGLGGLSRRWHQYIRSSVLTRTDSPRPVHFNTWEALYFEHDATCLHNLVDVAANVGVERFILDDGWFFGRHDDRAGLGDWTPCPIRYPQGLSPLAQYCRTLGMEFGLWVEPEGLSQNSELFRAHPEWALGVAGLEQPLGRHQYVLNFGLSEVRHHILAAMNNLLRNAPISFLKWDMNRDMTHAAGSNGSAGVRAHVLGVYAIVDSLRVAHPDLHIETCASGGARADLGILRHCDRVWVSDCNGPLTRQRIQAGFLQFFPSELMGAHVGDARSHTTGEVCSIEVRTLSALFGHFGIEANMLNMGDEDLVHLRAAIEVYKTNRDWVHAGHVTSIDHPDPNISAIMAISEDRSHAMVSIIALGQTRSAVPAALRLPFLKSDAKYRLQFHPLWLPSKQSGKSASDFHRGAALVLPGRVLHELGISLPVLSVSQGMLLQLELIV